MTIATTTAAISYAGNGVTTAFPVPFIFFASAEIEVIERSGSGAETTKVLSTDYAVSGGNGSTGTVTATAAPSAAVTWTIRRKTARTQLVDYVSNNPFPAETHERALDRLAATAQEIDREIGRAVLAPATETGFTLPPSVSRAGKLLGFDSAGNAVTYTVPTQAFTATAVSGLLKVGTNYGTQENTGLHLGAADNTEGGYGAFMREDGHANWVTVQSGINYNPIEFNLYPSAAQGQATGTSGTNTLTWVSGTLFDALWVGRLIFFNRTFYTVAAYNSPTSLTLSAAGGGGSLPFASTTTQTFHYVYTTTTGTCNTAGTAVTRLSGGQPFHSFMTSIVINGTTYSVASVNSKDSITLATSAGTQTAVSYSSFVDINNQLSTFRLQKVLGAWEENLTVAARASGEYWIGAIASGVGQAYPLRFSCGYVSGSLQYLFGISPGSDPTVSATAGNGYLSLGGFDGAEAMRVSRQNSNVNRLDVFGGTAGFGPSVRSRGETNVDMSFDTNGTGVFRFTTGAFARTALIITGAAGNDSYPQLDMGSGAAFLSAKGGTNAVLRLAGNGTGGVDVGAVGGRVGFYGATTVAKQTVTGAKGGNVALANLMTALNALGIVTDSTT